MLAGLHFLDLQMIQRGPWALVLALSLSLAGVSHLQTFLHTWLASLRQMLPSKASMVPGHDALASSSVGQMGINVLVQALSQQTGGARRPNQDTSPSAQQATVTRRMQTMRCST